MGANLKSMKTKLSAVAAIFATVFGVMAGGAPAHATSAYSSGGKAAVKMVYTADMGSGLTFTIPSGVNAVSTRVQVSLGSTAAAAFSGHNIKFALTFNGPNSTYVDGTGYGSANSPSLQSYISGNASPSGSFNSQSGYSPSTGYSVPANSTAVTTSLEYTFSTSSMMGSAAPDLAAGTYTANLSVQKDGITYPLDGTASGGQITVKTATWAVDGASQTNTQTYSSVTGVAAICINPSSLAANDQVSVHAVSNGSDDTLINSYGRVYYGPSSNNMSTGSLSPTFTVLSSWLSSNSTLAFVDQGASGALNAANGASNTFDLTLTKNGNTTDISQSCSAAPAAPTLTLGNTGQQSLNLSYTGSPSSCAVYLASAPTVPVVSGGQWGMPCNFSNPIDGATYVAKITNSVSPSLGFGMLTINWSLSGTSAASNSVTVSGAGITPTLSGGTGAGQAASASGSASLPAGYDTITSSDGGSGLLTLSYQNADGCFGNSCWGSSNSPVVSVRHILTSGLDSAFAGTGEYVPTPPSGNIYNIGLGMNGLNTGAPAWFGNKDKWSVVLNYSMPMMGFGSYSFITGNFANATTTVTNVSASVLTTACTSAGGSNFNMVNGVYPVSMGGSAALYRLECSNQMNMYYKLDVYFTVTSSTAINVVLNTLNGGTFNYDNLTTSSVNPSAGSADVALTLVYVNGNATASNYSTGGVLGTVVSRTIFRLKPDFTAYSSPTTSTWSANTALAVEPRLYSSVNNAGTIYSISPSLDVRALTTTGDYASRVVLTDDQAATFGSTGGTWTIGGLAQTSTTELYAARAVSGKLATAKINLSTGAITTGELVPLSSVRSTGYVSTTAFDASQNLYWFYTAVGSLSTLRTAKWRNFTVVQGPSSDASATISVNDGSAHAVQNNGTLNVANGVTSVTTTVTPTESHATVGTITGGSNLQVGNNTVSFTVTAQDGSTQNYSFTVVRAAQAMPTYVLTFDKNNQSATGTMATVSSSSSWAIPNSAGYSLTGYSFNGWNTLANGNGTSYAAGASVNLTADLTLYAQWLIDPFVLTFDKNNNLATGSQAAVSSRTSWSTPATVGYSLSGYLFDGWTTNANGTGTSYGSNAAVTLTQNTTLYAKWTQIPNDAVLCSVGTYSSHGGYRSTSNSWTCTNAPAGSFVATAGALTANLCPAGYFSAAAASTACTPASVGHFVASAGSTAEVACPANTHAYATGAAACDPDRVLSGNNNAKVVIGGKVVAPGATLRLTGAPNGLNVNVEMADNRARAYVTVPANPVIGDNVVTVFVEAENGSVAETTVIVHIDAPVVTPPVVTPPVVTPPVVTPPVVTPPVVTPPVVTPPAKSSDATAVITVAGITVADGDHVNLPFGTASVPVLVTPTESHATYAVTGATGLQTGTSVLTVTVTAEDGTVKAYSYQLVVAADKSPVNLGTASASVLQQVTAALDAGRVAFFNVTAKGAAAASKVLAQIRAFKTDLRAAGSTAKVSFSIKVTGASAVASVKVTP